MLFLLLVVFFFFFFSSRRRHTRSLCDWSSDVCSSDLSSHNGTQNPAIDTVAVGSTVTWTWTATGSVPHSVQSLGTPSFASSAIETGDGKTYSVTFTTPGTYQYDCAVHGAAMSGRIVVR